MHKVMGYIKSLIKSPVYLHGVHEKLNTQAEQDRIKHIKQWHSDIIDNLKIRISAGRKIRVGFYVVFKAAFPALNVFKLMLKDSVFAPKIVVIPDTLRGQNNTNSVIKDTYDYFHSLYPRETVLAYQSGSYTDVTPQFDLICSANPYDEMTHKFYTLDYLKDKTVLPFYMAYGYYFSKYYDKILRGSKNRDLLWLDFLDTPYTLRTLKQGVSRTDNALVTGFPKTDNIIYYDSPRKNDRKRIIIAPHHTIREWKNGLTLSNFLSYSDFFLDLPKLYPNIDFIFRPHPLLMYNLRSPDIWGEEKTAWYLQKLKENSNIVYDDSSDYTSQFIKSDAMIHDCGSFVAEYLFTGQPCCYMLTNKETIQDQFNDFGQKCVAQYYHAFGQEDIVRFIDNVVLKSEDSMKESRKIFLEEVLKENHPNAANMVVSCIKKRLDIDFVRVV